MVNVGDIAVSLTIEKGGNLDKLRRQLDNILDKEGKIDIDASFPEDIRMDIQYLRKKN